ncbi:YuiA family protein [Bacillus atrophaeus]|nr:YuiA family protein [Bacillus atrophaeus]MCY8972950.1 YuiA family protein [Bacillus atrophaeus]
MNTVTQSASKTCSLCSGKGYIQLLLGGSETCPSCGGTGKADRLFSSR